MIEQTLSNNIKRKIFDSFLNMLAVFLLLILLIIFSVTIKGFFSVSNFINIIKQISVIGIMSLGMTLAILSGGIDLSVSSILVTSMCIGGIAINNQWPIGAVYLVILLTGLVLGAVNGFFIVKLNISELLVTLATLSIYRGAINIITKGYEVYGIPRIYTKIGKSIYPILLLGGLYLIFVVVNSYTKFRRNIYAIGGNIEGAIFSGVPVKKYKMYIYMISGLLCAIAAILSIGRTMNITPEFGIGYELQVIAAVVVGGTSIWGGSGSVIRTLLGVTLMGVIIAAISMAGLNVYWQDFVIGSVILFAICIDSIRYYNFTKR